MRPDYQAVLDRFISACQEDDRVIAAFLAGSHARGAADALSDLDLGLITTDADFDAFIASRDAFIRRLGEPLFLEHFGNPSHIFYIFDNGVEGELAVGRESHFEQIHFGPYRVLLDRRGILNGVTFRGIQPEPAEQTEKLRQLITFFWHEWMHFTTALGRGQLWWAQGQLESLRGFCVSLARLQQNFMDGYAGQEPYFKIEDAMPVEQLAALTATFGPLDKDHLRESGRVILKVFKDLALPLAQAHGIPYPEALEQLMVKRLDEPA